MFRGIPFIACLAFGISSAAWLRGGARSPHPGVRVYTSRETGIPVNAWTAVQNDRGEMFFGCGDVVSFDGTRWQEHPIPRAYVRGLAVDGPRIWVAAYNEVGCLERDSVGHYAYTSLTAHLPTADRAMGDVWTVLMDEGAPVFVASQKLLRWRGGKFEIWNYPGPHRLSAFQAGGRTYVQYRGGGLFVIDRDGPRRIMDDKATKDLLIMWGETDPAGRMLFGTNRGFFRWDGAALTDVAPQFDDYMRGSFASSFLRLGNGKLAVGSIFRGVAIIDADWSNLSEIILSATEHDLPANGLFVDRNRGLWVTGIGYLARIDLDSRAQLFAASQGVEGELVEPLRERAGKLEVLTQTGLFAVEAGAPQAQALHRTTDGILESFIPWRDGHILGRIGGLEFVTDGHVELAGRTASDVLFVGPSRRRPDHFYYTDNFTLTEADASAGFPVRAQPLAILPDTPTTLVEMGSDVLLFGTSTSGVWRLARGAGELRQLPLPAAKVLGKDTSWVFPLDSRVYAFTTAGVFDVTDPGVPARRLLDSFPGGGQLVEMSEPGEDGEVWLILQNSRRTGAPGRYLAKLEIHDGRLGRSGAYDFPTLDTVAWVKSIATQREGSLRRIWVGGSGGVLTDLIDARADPRPSARPLLVSVESKAGPVSLDAPRVQLSYEARDLTFDFAVADYEHPDQLELQTRLMGFDDDWVAVAASGQRSIANLPAGDYALYLRSVSPAGAISPAAVWAFVIAPPWYRRPMAVAGLAVVVVGILAGLFQFRTRAIRRRNTLLEEQVRQRTAELEKANAAKTVFVASMSHEIRNPIHGILGLAYSLEGTPLNLLQQQYVGHIRQCANFLTSLVRDVLDFAKIEREEISLDFSLFEPSTLIETTVSMCEAKAQQAGMTIHTEVDKNLPGHLVGDSARIQQVLLNYLSNAIKYAGQGEIVLRAQLAGRVAGDLLVRFSVSDTGPGVPEGEREKLFTKFSRGKSAQDRSIHGTGLGLAISERIARRMGGQVGVDNPAGSGAEFWLEVPLQQATARVVAEPVATATSRRRTRILVADDETYNTLALAGMLHRLDCEVETASDGTVALDRLVAENFDVAFLDWELPGCNGIEVAREFRRRLPQAPTLLVAITAYNTEHNREACLAAGMNSFLAKPVHLRQLKDTLELLTRGPAESGPPAVAAESAGPADRTLSLRLLHYACRANGEPLPRALEDFMARVERDAAAYLAALERGDRLEAQKAAHGLAGHGAFIGADRFNELARRAHAHAGAEEWEEGRAVARDLGREWRAVRDILGSRLASEVSG